MVPQPVISQDWSIREHTVLQDFLCKLTTAALVAPDWFNSVVFTV